VSAAGSPPFRAEHIGSLLRPDRLIAARRRHGAGEIGSDELAAIEAQSIADAVKLQEEAGFAVITDGEFRRASYHSYFYSQLGDITIDAIPAAEASNGAADPGFTRDRHRTDERTSATTDVRGRGQQPVARIGSRIVRRGPIHVDDFLHLRAITGALPKITMPGPCALHFRGGDGAVTTSAYDDVELFWNDIVDAFRCELAALAAAGCRYVQIDETAFAKFGDPDVQAMLARRGDDWSSLIDRYIDVTNRVTHGFPELAIGMHLCRGNRGGRWHAEGSYEAVAERLFNRLDIGFFFLEYDSPRAGDFTPLRFVPNHKSVILGLVSTKTPAMEDIDDLRRRVADACRFVDPERLGISPQCGFASVETGNPITAEAQEAKLRLVVDLARSIWGTN
jgi:5-methyltetrahydropteroyltriglutamate--homocysteine methyltransferase